MTAAEMCALLQALGYAGTVRRGQVVLERCIFCGNGKGNLELSPLKGVYHCWVCRAGGRVDALLRQLTGRDYDVPVLLTAAASPGGGHVAAPPPALALQPLVAGTVAGEYVARRGVGWATVRAAGLLVAGARAQPRSWVGRVCVPMRDFWTETVVGYVGRAVTDAAEGPKYLSSLGPAAPAVGWRRAVGAGHGADPVLIVEGPFDGLAAWAAGYDVWVLLGQGRAAAVTAWGARLPLERAVGVMLDGDAAGAAGRMCAQLRPLRTGAPVQVVSLPEGADPATLGPEGVRAAVRAKAW